MKTIFKNSESMSKTGLKGYQIKSIKNNGMVIASFSKSFSKDIGSSQSSSFVFCSVSRDSLTCSLHNERYYCPEVRR